MKKTDQVKITVGMDVEIILRADRTQTQRVKGTVSKVLTSNQNHPHGVLVELETGEVGRVKTSQDLATPNKLNLKTKITSEKKIDVDIDNIISGGENHWVEFKTNVLWSSNFSNDDIKNHRPQSAELHLYGKATSKIIIAKAIAGFLNQDGGKLIIGVKENTDTLLCEVVGIEPDLNNLQISKNEDGYRLMLIDLIKAYFPSQIFNHLNNYIKIDFKTTASKKVCLLSIEKSDEHVFLKIKNSDHFFIRRDASTSEIKGKEIIDFIQKRFP